MTQQSAGTQLTDAELLVLKDILSNYIDINAGDENGDWQTLAIAESIGKKIIATEEDCKLYGCYFNFSLGDRKERFTVKQGTREDGVVWAIHKGLTPAQASKLYDKVAQQSLKTKMKPEERRKAFIDEVEFYLNF